MAVTCMSVAMVFKILTSLYSSSLQEAGHFMTTMQGINFSLRSLKEDDGKWPRNKSH